MALVVERAVIPKQRHRQVVPENRHRHRHGRTRSRTRPNGNLTHSQPNPSKLNPSPKCPTPRPSPSRSRPWRPSDRSAWRLWPSSSAKEGRSRRRRRRLPVPHKPRPRHGSSSSSSKPNGDGGHSSRPRRRSGSGGRRPGGRSSRWPFLVRRRMGLLPLGLSSTANSSRNNNGSSRVLRGQLFRSTMPRNSGSTNSNLVRHRITTPPTGLATVPPTIAGRLRRSLPQPDPTPPLKIVPIPQHYRQRGGPGASHVCPDH